MPIPLRTLIVEDSENDAELLVRTLQRGGYEPAYQRVDTAQAMQAALEQSAWDVVISDYSMPSFSGIAALRLLQQHGIDIPFIMLSGVVGEEIAVTAMKAGAHDFVTKGNLVRLVPAIERELREAALRREHKRMERALRISQDQFLSFMEYTPLVCWIADEESRLRYANTGFSRLLGTVPDSLTGKNLAELFPPQHAAVYLANNQRVLDTGEVLERMESVPRPAGDIGQFLTYRFPLQGIGKERLIGSVGLDITERLRAEEARARLAAIVESSNDAIITRGLDGMILSWNAGAERMFGWQAHEAIGRHIRMLVPSELHGTLRPLTARAARGEVVAPADTMRMRKDGTRIHVQVSFSAVKDESGKVVSIANLVRDITERKQGEEARARLAAIVESSNDAIISRGLDGTILSWNTGATKLFGWTAQEAIGQDIRITMPAEDHGAMVPLVERVVRGEVLEPVDTRRVRKDGTFFHAQVSYSAVRDGNGSIVSLAVILRDVSDRKRAEETLRALEHEQRLLAQLAESERARLAEAQSVAKIGSWETELPSLNVTWSEETYRIFEVDPGRFVPTHAGFLEFVHPEDRAMVEAAFAASLEEQLPGTIEHRIVMADGRIKFVEERWHVFPGSVQGLAERAAGTCQDITERKLAEARILDYAEQMRSLTQRLSEVEETERRNINRELHDRIGPNLVALKLNFHLARSRLPPELQKTIGAQIEDAQKVLETTVAQLRNVMADLRPPALDDYGLLAALRTYAEPYSARLGIPVNVLGTDINPRLSLTAETTLFRIAQEALNNIAKHAQAKRVEITVQATASHVILLVSDDGKGFDPGRPDPQRSSWGLKTMRERAQAIGADLQIESAPGNGTRILVKAARGAA
jgi:PAS domain S-box-containing protein